MNWHQPLTRVCALEGSSRVTGKYKFLVQLLQWPLWSVAAPQPLCVLPAPYMRPLLKSTLWV